MDGRIISRSEVQNHSSTESFWVIYKNKVYDLTSFYPSHPGGEAILKHAGKDITFVIKKVPAHNFSQSFITKKLAECYIGRLE